MILKNIAFVTSPLEKFPGKILKGRKIKRLV